MGLHPEIIGDRMPLQGEWLGKRTTVIFHYDTSRQYDGTIVRDDVYVAGVPCVTIIKLDDGRYVLTTECQQSPA